MTDMNNDETTIWIQTEPSVDGSTYIVTLSVGDFISALTPTTAVTHARAVLQAAQRAEYDAAVYAQILDTIGKQNDTSAEEANQLAAQVIVDLRKDRAPAGDAAPLELSPGVNQKGKPFIGIHINKKQIGQWKVSQAREHALAVLEVSEAADLDAAYHRALRGLIKVEDHVARNVISGLAQYRDDS